MLHRPDVAADRRREHRTLEAYGFEVIANGLGVSTFAAPVPSNPALHGLAVYWQAAEYVAGGPVFGSFAITNGLVTVLGN